MNSFLIPGLAVALIVILIIILKIVLTKKTPPAVTPEPEIAEQAPVVPGEEKAEVEGEEVSPLPREGVEETTGPLAEPEELAEVEEPEAVAEELAEVEEPEVEEEREDLVAPELEPVAAISIEFYTQHLLVLKDEKLAALTTAIEDNEEKSREQLQVELVTLTEALDFLDQSYEQDIACRNDSLTVLQKMVAEVNADEYNRARESLCNDDTLAAELVFDKLVDQDSPLSALAAYQSGCLAECRIDISRAMERYEKAVSLDDTNPDYLRSAALLARKLYNHKKALFWFSSLEKVLEEQSDESVELALARRELAYTSALIGKHQQAGALYKKAMVSIANLLGNDDPEMGICWYQIGKLQEAVGKYEKAEEPYSKALAIMDKTGKNVVLVNILDKLAGLYIELEMEDRAIVLFERLCSFREESANPDNATLSITYNNLAEAYKFSGKYEQAEKQYLRCLTLTEELRGKDHAAVGSILQELVKTSQKLGKMDDAKAYQERATAIFQRVVEEQEAAGQEDTMSQGLPW